MTATMARLPGRKRKFNPLLVCYRCDGGTGGMETENERRRI
jgi:hypothetical protein